MQAFTMCTVTDSSVATLIHLHIFMHTLVLLLLF